jgi:hypothetical protein
MSRMFAYFQEKEGIAKFLPALGPSLFPKCNLAERLYWRTYKDGRITTDLLTNVSED